MAKYYWTKDDEDFLKANYLYMDDYEIAEKYNVTPNAVRIKRHKLGLTLYMQENCPPIKGEVWVRISKTCEISNKCRVRKNGCYILSQRVINNGYVVVRPDNTHWLLHRLMWTAFNGEIPNGYEIDHIDGNKLNNSLYNLELVTHSENLKRAYDSGRYNDYYKKKNIEKYQENNA